MGLIAGWLFRRAYYSRLGSPHCPKCIVFGGRETRMKRDGGGFFKCEVCGYEEWPTPKDKEFGDRIRAEYFAKKEEAP